MAIVEFDDSFVVANNIQTCIIAKDENNDDWWIYITFDGFNREFKTLFENEELAKEAYKKILQLLKNKKKG